MEGSEEIQDAVNIATTASLPVQKTANKAIRQYKRKLQEQKKERRKHSRLRSEKEHAEISMKMRRSKSSMAKGKGELIVFRDSFGSSLIPLLAEEYEKITLVDIRYISSSLLGEFISFDGQQVLFLYSSLLLNSSMGMK